MRTRIAVTGMGVITATGRTRQEFAEALMSGRCGIRPVTLFDASAFPSPVMGEIQGFSSPRPGLDRASQLALAAAWSAVADAGTDWIATHRDRAGVVLGTTCGGVTSHERILDEARRGGGATCEAMDEVPFHAMARHIAREFQLEAPVATLTTACASGANAVGLAADLIRGGHADIMLAGGSDTVSAFTFSGFSSLRAIAKDTCRPFDRNRSGISLGEGAAVLVLEELERARRRGATIHAEILGCGFCGDAYHSTAPDPRGGGMARSIEHALSKASLEPDQVDYINAHGTGTPANDTMECNAYERVFGARVRRIPVSSTKSMIGHTLGAAGAIELVATILAIQGQFAPPTVNFATPDPECDLDVVPNQSRAHEIRRALCCNAGFAGNNAAVVVGAA